eukprot:jgi/Tetstr1/427168/TSEL_017356.t1
MARVQSSTPGGGVDWQFQCCDGSCRRTYQRPAPMCTHVNHGMESDDPTVAAMHLAYAATFDPSVYICAVLASGRCSAGTRRLLPQPPMMPPSRLLLGDRMLAYVDRFPPTDNRSYGAEDAVCVFAGLLLRPYPSSSPAVVRKLAERRVRLWEAGDAVRAGFSVCGMRQVWRESRDGSELHNYHFEAGELPAGTSRSARRRKRRRSARARAASAEAAEGGADDAADGVPPAVVDAHRRAAKLAAVQELRRARQAMDTADLGMVSDAAAGLLVLEALHPPPAPTDPEYSPAHESPDLRRAPPSWGGNADEGHGRTFVAPVGESLPGGAVPLAHCGFLGEWHRLCAPQGKDDLAAREERAKTGEPLRVRPLGVGSVLVRLASAHALVQVGADAREAMGPDGVVYLGAPISHHPGRLTRALGRRREAHAALLERIASFGTSGYGCHNGAMRLLVVCAVRQTGFLSRMMPPSELDPFLEAVDAANNISAAFSLLAIASYRWYEYCQYRYYMRFCM